MIVNINSAEFWWAVFLEWLTNESGFAISSSMTIARDLIIADTTPH